MTLVERIGKDMVAAMKARDEARLSTLRMMKSGLKNKEIEKRAPLNDAEAQTALQTMIKQRRESIAMFIKGNRPELAAREEAEIAVLEGYLPQEASAEDIAEHVTREITAIAEANGGVNPTQKEMGAVMKAVQASIAAAGLRADNKQVSEIVRSELSRMGRG